MIESIVTVQDPSEEELKRITQVREDHVHMILMFQLVLSTHLNEYKTHFLPLDKLSFLQEFTELKEGL